MTTDQARQARTHGEAMNNPYADLAAREIFSLFNTEERAEQTVVFGLTNIDVEDTVLNIIYEEDKIAWEFYRNGRFNDGIFYPVEEYLLPPENKLPKVILFAIDCDDPFILNYEGLIESMKKIREANEGVRCLVVTSRKVALTLSGISMGAIPFRIVS